MEWSRICGCMSGVKVIHRNRLFLVATPRGHATSLGGSKSASEEGATWFTLAELTPLECIGDRSNSEMGTAFTGIMPSNAIALQAMIPGRHP